MTHQNASWKLWCRRDVFADPDWVITGKPLLSTSLKPATRDNKHRFSTLYATLNMELLLYLKYYIKRGYNVARVQRWTQCIHSRTHLQYIWKTNVLQPRKIGHKSSDTFQAIKDVLLTHLSLFGCNLTSKIIDIDWGRLKERSNRGPCSEQTMSWYSICALRESSFHHVALTHRFVWL